MELAPTMAVVVSGPRSPGLVSSDNAATQVVVLPVATGPQAGQR
jgi:hypothetical protein